MSNNKKDNQEGGSKVSINWYPGHMAKTKKQIAEDLKLIDIVVEILDARIPEASVNPDIRELTQSKKRIIVLNKSDLADERITKKWIEFYRKKGIAAIEVEANNNKGINNVIQAIIAEYKEIKEKYVQKGRIGKTAKVMVLGIPNVGKSTFINSISKRTATKVGNKPGVTKQKQWIKINEGIELMDTPGMLWPKLDDAELAMHLAFIGTIGDNAIDNEEVAYKLLEYFIGKYPDKIEERYKINVKEKGTIEVVEEIANKRGAKLAGNEVNMQKVSDIILNEFRSGKLGRITIEIPR